MRRLLTTYTTTHSALNPIIYSCFNVKIKRGLIELCCKTCRPAESGSPVSQVRYCYYKGGQGRANQTLITRRTLTSGSSSGGGEGSGSRGGVVGGRGSSLVSQQKQQQQSYQQQHQQQLLLKQQRRDEEDQYQEQQQQQQQQHSLDTVTLVDANTVKVRLANRFSCSDKGVHSNGNVAPSRV